MIATGEPLGRVKMKADGSLDLDPPFLAQVPGEQQSSDRDVLTTLTVRGRVMFSSDKPLQRLFSAPPPALRPALEIGTEDMLHRCKMAPHPDVAFTVHEIVTRVSAPWNDGKKG